MNNKNRKNRKNKKNKKNNNDSQIKLLDVLKTIVDYTTYDNENNKEEIVMEKKEEIVIEKKEEIVMEKKEEIVMEKKEEIVIEKKEENVMEKYNLIYNGGNIKNGNKVTLCGNVLLRGSIYVEKDGILEIKSGTHIYIENTCEPIIIVIHNEGIINAFGTNCEKIVFQSVHQNCHKGLWGGIIILGYNYYCNDN